MSVSYQVVLAADASPPLRWSCELQDSYSSHTESHLGRARAFRRLSSKLQMRSLRVPAATSVQLSVAGLRTERAEYHRSPLLTNCAERGCRVDTPHASRRWPSCRLSRALLWAARAATGRETPSCHLRLCGRRRQSRTHRGQSRSSTARKLRVVHRLISSAEGRLQMQPACA